MAKCYWCKEEAFPGRLTCNDVHCSEKHAEAAQAKRGKSFGRELSPEEAMEVRKRLGKKEHE